MFGPADKFSAEKGGRIQQTVEKKIICLALVTGKLS